MWGSSTWHRPRNFILQLVWPRTLLLFIVASALALVYFFDRKTWTYRLRLSSIAASETFLPGVSPFFFLPFPFFAFVAREITKSVLISHEQNVERSGTRQAIFLITRSVCEKRWRKLRWKKENETVANASSNDFSRMFTSKHRSATFSRSAFRFPFVLPASS